MFLTYESCCHLLSLWFSQSEILVLPVSVQESLAFWKTHPWSHPSAKSGCLTWCQRICSLHKNSRTLLSQYHVKVIGWGTWTLPEILFFTHLFLGFSWPPHYTNLLKLGCSLCNQSTPTISLVLLPSLHCYLSFFSLHMGLLPRLFWFGVFFSVLLPCTISLAFFGLSFYCSPCKSLTSVCILYLVIAYHMSIKCSSVLLPFEAFLT